jgi:hypothetical protein
VVCTSLAASRVTRGEPGWRTAAQRARSALRASPDEPLLVTLHLQEARGHLESRDLPSAIVSAREALEGFTRLQERGNANLAHSVLAVALATLGELDEAWRHAERSVEGRLKPETRVIVLARRGQVAMMRTDRPAAESALAEARELALRSGLGQPTSESAIELERLRRALG